MHYNVVLFGVKDTTEVTIDFITREICPVDLLVTIDPGVTKKNQISGFKSLKEAAESRGIPVFSATTYGLRDEETIRMFSENTFDIGVVVGWQRLIPKQVLDAFRIGVFGFHGNSGYLPFGRGRSPLNWSVILGDTRFNLNLFRYDEKADSPNVYGTEMFSISPHDDIRTAQYKNMICTNRLLKRLLTQYVNGEEIVIRTGSKDFDSWYDKRTAADGRIDWHARTRDIYNLIRGVAAPFPGAFCGAADEEQRESLTAYMEGREDPPEIAEDKKVTVWKAQPFDEMMDFSMYAPGEVAEVFDGKLIVRTVDGSILIDRYECQFEIRRGMLLY